MKTEIPMAAAPGSNAGLIAFDLTCLGCGYNLRGLRDDGVCPECAELVARSLRGDWLVHSPATWLRRLRSGSELMLVYVVLHIILSVAALLLAGRGGMDIMVIVVPSLLIETLFVGSLFLLTAREPRTGTHRDPAILRNIVRVGAVASFVAELASTCCAWAEYFGSMMLIQTAAQLTGLVTILCILMLLARLARRVPDVKLAKSTRTVMWGIIIAPALFVASAMLAAAAGINGTIETIATGLLVAGGVMLIAVAILFVIILIKLRSVFLTAERLSGGMVATQRARPPGAKL